MIAVLVALDSSEVGRENQPKKNLNSISLEAYSLFLFQMHTISYCCRNNDPILLQ